MIGAVNRARAVLTALLLTSALGLAGCSDDDPEPAPAPPSSEPASPSTTAASGPTPPEMPDAAKARTDKGAEAFVRYWLEVVNHAQATGETQVLEAMSESTCAGCRGIAEAVTEAYKGGGHIEGGELMVGRLRELPLDYEADWAAYGLGKVAPQMVVTADGRRVESTGGPFRFYAYLAWHNGWKFTWLRTPS